MKKFFTYRGWMMGVFMGMTGNDLSFHYSDRRGAPIREVYDSLRETEEETNNHIQLKFEHFKKSIEFFLRKMTAKDRRKFLKKYPIRKGKG